MKKGKILFLVLFTIIMSSSASAINITSQLTNQEEGIIKGTVKLAVTCIPYPLSDVTIKAKKLNPIDKEIYTTKTNSNGEFEFEVSIGKYFIIAQKENYSLTFPKVGYIKTVESEKTYNLSFYMVPSEGRINTANGYKNLKIKETLEFIQSSDKLKKNLVITTILGIVKEKTSIIDNRNIIFNQIMHSYPIVTKIFNFI